MMGAHCRISGVSAEEEFIEPETSNVETENQIPNNHDLQQLVQQHTGYAQEE